MTAGPDRTRLTDRDLAACVDYIDGLLEQREQLEFEQRLAAEPELATHVQRLLETDELLRAAQRTGALAVRRPRVRIARTAALAAAAALLAWAGFGLFRASRPQPFEVALAPSFESARDYVATVETLEDLRPPGLESLRGGGGAPNVEPERFLELAAVAERRARAEALSRAAEAIEAPYFVVQLRLAEASDVVVASIVPGGAAERLHPPAGGDASLARMPAGEHALPGERFELAGAGRSARVRYRRGFLAPVGAQETAVVIGVRPAGDGGAGVEPSPAELASRSVEELSAALRAAGFETVTRLVREPR